MVCRSLVLVSVLWLWCSGSDGQQLVDAGPRNFSDEVNASADALRVFADQAAKEPLEMVSAYKWANTARKPLGDRLCVLYLKEGRPVASCKIYPTGKSIVHTPISMSNLPIEGRMDGDVVWTPPASAPELYRLKNELPPSAAAPQRRIQMKRIARAFTASTDEGEAKRQKSVPELRLLPTPIHTYSSPQQAETDIIGGAVFCFVVEGGNPQILMLLEAVKEGETMYWQCSFSRRTFAELRVSYRDSEIWTVSSLPGSQMQRAGSFHRIVSPLPQLAK